jgi:CheY-like chemotaxis protein
VPETTVPDAALTAQAESAADAGGGEGDEAREAPASAAVPATQQGLAEALHEVSNALTVVLGWIERARADKASPGGVERALDVAASRAAQARSIVRRAIGAEVPPDGPRSASWVLDEAVVGLEPEARRAGLEVEVMADPALEALSLDHAASAVQVLTNLLLNALAVSPRGGTVTVDARPSAGGRGVVFGVADEGPGIPRHRRRTLFTAGVSTRPGGAGLGLRHAAGLARTSGGELGLVDTLRGARFELRWPAVDAVPASSRGAISHEHGIDPHAPFAAEGPTPLPLPPPRAAASLDGARILVVEDDEAVIDLLDTALTARGADVVAVRRRGELGGALATGRFDMALFDISPIQDDVSGALAAARGSSAELRVVLISGSAAQMPDVPHGWVSAWVRKPFEMSEILSALRSEGGSRKA